MIMYSFTIVDHHTISDVLFSVISLVQFDSPKFKEPIRTKGYIMIMSIFTLMFMLMIDCVNVICWGMFFSLKIQYFEPQLILSCTYQKRTIDYVM